MIPLRQLFLVDNLREAATSKDPIQLQVIRDIIRRMKLAQLERMEVATDGMIVEFLERLYEEKQQELQLISKHLAQARNHTSLVQD